jgi:hypothetical protein
MFAIEVPRLLAKPNLFNQLEPFPTLDPHAVKYEDDCGIDLSDTLYRGANARTCPPMRRLKFAQRLLSLLETKNSYNRWGSNWEAIHFVIPVSHSGFGFSPGTSFHVILTHKRRLTPIDSGCAER